MCVAFFVFKIIYFWFAEWRLATSDKKQRMLHRQVNCETHMHKRAHAHTVT